MPANPPDSDSRPLWCPWMVPTGNCYRSPDSGDYNHLRYNTAFVGVQFSRPPLDSSLTGVQDSMSFTRTCARLVSAVPGTDNADPVVLNGRIWLGFTQSMILSFLSLSFLSQSPDTGEVGACYCCRVRSQITVSVGLWLRVGVVKWSNKLAQGSWNGLVSWWRQY